jgi:hypothetical protein
LLNLVIITNTEDNWIWNPGGEEGFSLKSTYVFLDHTLNLYQQLPSLLSFAFKFIWKCGVPSKVSAFAWQLLLERLPTRDNLRRRGVVSVEGVSCPLCLAEIESATNLFLHCRFAAGIWYDINRWLGVVSVLPPSVPLSYALLVGGGSNKRRRKCFSIIWLAYVWVLWKTRNDVVFNNVAVDVPTVVDRIHRLSWFWFLNNTAKDSCLLYEWVWSPTDCMML